jgi:hypothetical protein
MSIAPYHNEHNMSAPRILGEFRLCDASGVFEYSDRPAGDRGGVWAEYPQRIFTADGDRAARVGKTVAYVVIDEAADGSPVVEKWKLRGHRVFATAAQAA